MSAQRRPRSGVVGCSQLKHECSCHGLVSAAWEGAGRYLGRRRLRASNAETRNEFCRRSNCYSHIRFSGWCALHAALIPRLSYSASVPRATTPTHGLIRGSIARLEYWNRTENPGLFLMSDDFQSKISSRRRLTKTGERLSRRSLPRFCHCARPERKYSGTRPNTSHTTTNEKGPLLYLSKNHSLTSTNFFRFRADPLFSPS